MNLTQQEILNEIEIFKTGIEETLPDISPLLVAFTYDYNKTKFGKLLLPDPILDLYFKYNQIIKVAELLRVMSENLFKEANQKIIGVLSISEGHLNDIDKPLIIFSYQSTCKDRTCLIPYYLNNNKLVVTKINSQFSHHYHGHIGKELARAE